VFGLGFLSGVGLTGCGDYESSCCKECSTGKPCGDSCIAVTSTCNSPPGCACYGDGGSDGNEESGANESDLPN
jgi:hypothetical protein